MTFEKFRSLVRGGEKAFVDFKLMCNAFNGAVDVREREKSKAELVKDICAMANNGGQTSYLIIGVKNARKTTQSVSDPNLTAANIQTLVRDSIHPRPFIKVESHVWAKAPKPFGGVRFVVIQVGPHLKGAFRFARDFVEDGKKFCFRKHQVWIRRDDTSDLATPEEIVALCSKKRAPEPEPEFTNTGYLKLAHDKQLPTIRQELRSLLVERGCKISVQPPPRFSERLSDEFRVSLPIRGRRFVLRCCAREWMGTGRTQATMMRDYWNLEHGMLIILQGAISKTAKPQHSVNVDYPSDWGHLAVLRPGVFNGVRSRITPQFQDVRIFLVTVARIHDTRSLRKGVLAAIENLSDETLFGHIDKARSEVNKALKRSDGKDFDTYSREERNIFLRNRRSMMTLLNNSSD